MKRKPEPARREELTEQQLEQLHRKTQRWLWKMQSGALRNLWLGRKV